MKVEFFRGLEMFIFYEPVLSAGNKLYKPIVINMIRRFKRKAVFLMLYYKFAGNKINCTGEFYLQQLLKPTSLSNLPLIFEEKQM